MMFSSWWIRCWQRLISPSGPFALKPIMQENSYSPIEAPAPKAAILVVALCGAEPRPRSILIDRKFHEGMLGFAERLDRPFTCVLPRLTPTEAKHAMDMIEVSTSELPYRVNLLDPPISTAASLRLIERSLDGVGLVYLGAFEDLNLRVASLCRARGIPYAVVSEYTLRTELEIMRACTASPARRLWRAAKIRLRKRRRLECVASAREVHANGYPTYSELAAANPRRMLFLDTRARAQDIIGNAELRAR